MSSPRDLLETRNAPPEPGGRQTERDAGGLFPLPLVPFERYMVADDCEAYPMTFVVEVDLEGTPDRPAMEAALDEALKRHPLLTARLARKGRGLYWIPDEEARAPLQWFTPAEDPGAPVGERIHLELQPGLRLHAVVCGRTTKLTFLFHHAACDGLGCFRFIGDLLAYYGRRTASAGMAPTLLPVDPGHLRYRGSFNIRIPAAVTRWQVIRSMIRESWKVASRRPRSLVVRERPGPERRSVRRTMPVAYLGADVYRGLRARATELGVTANDIMVRDMFLTICRWNEMQGSRPARRWLRVTMPTAMWGRRDNRMPATNMLGYALLTRREDECSDPDRLLSDLAADTDAVRKWGLGSLFVDGIRMLDAIPGLLRLSARASRRFSTAVLSNLGDPVRRFRARFPSVGGEIRVGNLVLRSVVGAPPVRPGTRAALALMTCFGKLAIAIRCDPHWFGAEDEGRLLSLYRRRLQESAGFPSESV